MCNEVRMLKVWQVVKRTGKCAETIRRMCIEGKFEGAGKDIGGHQWEIPESALEKRKMQHHTKS